MHSTLRLGINIDHVATVRQARGGVSPQPLQLAWEAALGGADLLTIHLREDRRHIQDDDVYLLKARADLPINLEMALADDILKIACDLKPKYACLVPENRAELTTEGGLDVVKHFSRVKESILALSEAQISVNIFIEPELSQIDCARELMAEGIELHTGAYANAHSEKERNHHVERLMAASTHAKAIGLNVHAGHGLDYCNVQPIANIPEVTELNIGHAIVARALITGMQQAVRDMKSIMHTGRCA